MAAVAGDGLRAAPALPPPRSPRIASYTIAATLDRRQHTITGEEQLVWRNATRTPARTLQFHLYYNAWRNAESTWMRERRLAGDEMPHRSASDWGSIDLTRILLRTPNGPTTDLGPTLRFIAPDDGNAEDRTVAEVTLPAAVAPGESTALTIAWTSHVPRTFARTGVIGDFYFLGQWFPKIGVLEDTGWNCHQFHASTEFFSDFGSYDVQLTVPTGWTVGATGTEQGRRDAGNGLTTHHYAAADVHDFAWTTSPDYLERIATFTHPTLPPVVMRLLLQPEHASQADRHFAAVRATLRYYGEWFGPYPYAQITIVDPAWQSGADGMEYPTLFTAGTRWLAPVSQGEPEEVTVHEAGHQFWYGLVANNEFEHAWMDEGVNTFSTARTLAQSSTPLFFGKRYFGGFIPWTVRAAPLRMPEDEDGLAGYAAEPHGDMPSIPSYRYWPATAGLVTYSKTGLWLATLERMVGWETMQRIMSTYFARFTFEHPKPADFFAIVNEISGRDFTWFFDRVYRSSVAFDYAVDVFTSQPYDTRGSRMFRTQVVVRRNEDGVFPVDVQVRFENGEEVRWHWTGEERWKAYEVEKPVRAISAQVDPEHVLLLDRNYTNNSATLTSETAGRAAGKWSLTWLLWLQDHLLTYGFFV